MPERASAKPFGLQPDPAEWDTVLAIMTQLDEQVPYHEIAAELGIDVGAVHQVQERRDFYSRFEASASGRDPEGEADSA